MLPLASSTAVAPKVYVLSLPSTKPLPFSVTDAEEPSETTELTDMPETTGTICNTASVASASPTTRTWPVTVLAGTTIVADVPSAAAVAGCNTTWPLLPLLSTVSNTMSVVRSRPLPWMVIVCPGLADASPAFAGVPDVAVAAMPVKASGYAALVPPSVVTDNGPLPTPLGTVKFIEWPVL